ncbi:outer membrane protein assembly factor BamB family protein [Fulvivirga lutea]|uniref:PQQ-binding-like beta-propeller repeat protein n=1 Tax=Fulvivirga lutea TaxID=2810512 RepID=A0A974ZZA4_9BACT|nr:PQQ-binding-like beta-propeller repeat protein [Fulvivirga lutea]QSE95919.1 PQQ-binding-like beta-propeller repeat protein [Fulvivirga lutea]
MKYTVYAIIFIVALVTSCSTEENTDSLVGYWQGEAVFNNQKTLIGLEFIEDSVGYEVNLLVPAYDWSFNFKGVTTNNDTIKIGGWKLNYDKEHQLVLGKLPGVLVPKYEIPFQLKKAEKPELKEAQLLPTTKKPSAVIDLHESIWSGISTIEGSILAATTDGHLFRVNPNNQSVEWSFKGQGAFRSEPTVHEDNIYVYSDKGLFYCISKAGQMNWKVQLEVDSMERFAKNYDFFSAIPAFTEDRIYYGNGSGDFYAINKANGNVAWRYKTSGAIRTRPLVKDERIVFGSFDGRVYALNRDGELVWNYDSGYPIVGGGTLYDDQLIFGSRNYNLFALSLAGEMEWQYYNWFSWVESTPVIKNDKLFVGSSDAQTITALNPANGKLIWNFDTGGCPWASPLVTEGNVYAATVGNNSYFYKHFAYIIALNSETGEEQWRYAVENVKDTYYGFTSSPVLIDNMIWVGNTDGRIYGFKQ